jgi:hypothetical protein
VVTDSVRIGGQTIKVELVMITDTHRRALEDSASGNTSSISGKGQATSGTGKITTATRRAFSASYATSSVPPNRTSVPPNRKSDYVAIKPSAYVVPLTKRRPRSPSAMTVFVGALDGGEFCEAAGPALAGQTTLMLDRNMLMGTGKTMRCFARYSSRLYISPLLIGDM